MFRAIKNLFLIIFFTICLIGLVMSTSSYFGILFISEYAIPLWIYGALLGIPIVFIPAIGIAMVKIVKYKGIEYKYGIRFWPAIRNIPKQFAIAIYVLSLNVGIMLLLNYLGYGRDSLVLSSGLMLFYYVPTIIYLSSLRG